MELPTFNSLCRKGEAADKLYNDGRLHEAQNAYTAILGDLERTGLIDSYLIAKTTLGLLLTNIRLGRFPDAFAIWNANIEESLFGIGIYALEHAQTSIHDMLLYDFVCACLHSFSDGDKDASGQAVNQYMSRVYEFLSEHEDQDPDLLRLAVSNWKTHLKEIFGTSIPHDLARPLINAERALAQGQVRPQALDFPPPSPWEKPEGFREVSIIIPFEPLRYRTAGKQRMEDGGAARKLKRK